jgi:PAS domain S-box-containing protein
VFPDALALRDVLSVTGSKAPLISIVDDDALARDGIAALVESLGYNVITFTSADHFLGSDMIAETTCLITDMQMPGLNGLELQEALQSQGHQTPVIVITGYPNEKHRTRALENGAVGYLSKPFDEQTLVECLSAAIKSRSSPARQESSDEAIVSKDLNGAVTTWNKAAERLFGYPAKEVVGKSITILIPSDRLNEEGEILGRIRRGERVDHFETLRQCKDGSLVMVSLTISPVTDDSGKIIGASKIVHPLSADRMIE